MSPVAPPLPTPMLLPIATDYTRRPEKTATIVFR